MVSVAVGRKEVEVLVVRMVEVWVMVRTIDVVEVVAAEIGSSVPGLR